MIRNLTKQDIILIIHSENANHIIVEAKINSGKLIDSGNYGTVLAKSKDGQQWVTWQFHIENGIPSFYWGHYFFDEVDAIKDYDRRGR